MKTSIFVVLGIYLAGFTATLSAQSRLNNDPKVVYFEQISDKPVYMLTAKRTPVFVAKKGGRRIGYVEEKQKVELLAITKDAYRIKGPGKNGKITGWTSPRYLASKDPEFVKNLTALYKRQMLVKQLIEKGEVAIGMSLDEVGKVMGEPTKKQVRTTATGKSGTYQYITYDEQQHFAFVRDPRTGQVFRQLTHVTREETGKLVVEFKGDIVTAIEETEKENSPDIRIITPPIVFW